LISSKWPEGISWSNDGMKCAVVFAGDEKIDPREPQLAIFDTSELPQKVKTHLLKEKPHKAGLHAVTFCGDKTNKILTGGKDKNVILWKTKETGNTTEILHYRHTANVLCLYYNPIQHFAYSGGNDRRYICYSLQDNKIVQERKFEAAINNIKNQPTNPFVLLVSQMATEKQLNILDSRCQSVVISLSYEEHIIEDKKRKYSGYIVCNWSPDGNMVANGSVTNRIYLWDIRYVNRKEKGSQVLSLLSDASPTLPKEKIQLFQGESAITIPSSQQFEAHNSKVLAAAFHPTKSMLISLSTDKALGFHTYQLRNV